MEKTGFPDLVNRSKAAELLGVKPNTLAVWSCNKRYDLPVVKVGRAVRYRMDDLKNFINNNTEGFSDYE